MIVNNMSFKENLILILTCVSTFILYKWYINTVKHFIDKKYENTEVKIY